MVACGQAGFNVVIANTHAHGRPVEWRIDTLDLYITAELVIL